MGDSAESEAAAAEVDPQLATMVWIAHLKGGPQPLVSPLQPPPSPSPPPPLASPDRSRKRSDHESFPSRRWSPPPAPGHDTRQPSKLAFLLSSVRMRSVGGSSFSRYVVSVFCQNAGAMPGPRVPPKKLQKNLDPGSHYPPTPRPLP